jgi:hypothetical protein
MNLNLRVGNERPAAPGGGLRDRRRRRRGSWMRGESRRALGVATECTMLMCILSVSCHPAPSLLSCRKTVLRGAAPSSPSRSWAEQDKASGDGGAERPRPRSEAQAPAPCPCRYGPYGSPSRRPQGCQGSAARAPRHQVAAHRRQLPPLAEEVLDGYSLVLCTV